jgi:hypothetical protein
MSKVPATSTASGSFSPNFEEIFAAALDEYKKKTKRDIASNPLAIQLQSCDSPAAVLSVLRARVKKLEQSQSADEKWVKWVDPTVNVLFAFSATLGNGVGVVRNNDPPEIYYVICVTIGIPTCKRGFHGHRGPSPGGRLPYSACISR